MQNLAHDIVKFAMDYDDYLSNRYSTDVEENYADSNYNYLQFQIPKIALIAAIDQLLAGDEMIDGMVIDKIILGRMHPKDDVDYNRSPEIVEIFAGKGELYYDIVVRSEKPRWQNTNLSYRDPKNQSSL